MAIYRAQESERPDAIFRDPLARRLAGERGEQIARQMKRGSEGWTVVVRTLTFDRHIAELATRVDTVLNLGAGLDARPYRMDLPPGLRWIEADTPALIAEKERLLGGERPRCRLERIGLDLADARERAVLLDRVDAASKAALVITEGVLVYLAEEAVADLGDDLAARDCFGWWLADLAPPPLIEWSRKNWKPLAGAGAPMLFGPRQGSAFFEPHGWREAAFSSFLDDAFELARAPWMFSLLRPLMRRRGSRTSEWAKGGCALLERAGSVGKPLSAAAGPP